MEKKNSVSSNFIWRFLERFGAQGVTLAVSIVLARHLGPEVYGTAAVVTIFTTVLSTFINYGLKEALIQKKDADDLDFSSVFYFNVALCLSLYALMFLLARPIAALYRNDGLVPVIRGLSLILIPIGIRSIQIAYAARNMLFKRFFFATLAGTVTAAVVGIWMAVKGYGVWALIVQNLVNTTLDTVILWLTVRWRPLPRFSFERLKSLFRYGWKITASALVDIAYGRLYQFVVGLRYGEADLAIYNKGETMPTMVVSTFNESTNSVLFSLMSQEQDDTHKVRNTTKRAVSVSSFLIMPVLAGMAACALPGIRLLLGEQWLGSVPFLQIFCLTYAFECVHTANLNAIKAMGRSDIYLKVEIIKRAVGIATLLVTVRISPLAMALGSVFNCLVFQIVNSWPNRKLIAYPYEEQLKDFLPQLLLAIGMAAAVWCVSLLGLPDLVTLLIQVPLGFVIYLGGARLFKLAAFTDALKIGKSLLKRA